MPGKRATGEEIVAHFDSLPRAAGTVEQRVAATARYFKVEPLTVKNHLKFWWPGRKYLQEFEPKRKDGQVRWDRPTEELLKTMNECGSVAKGAATLKTTAVTLTKTLERHGIVQKWVIKAEGDMVAPKRGRRRKTA